MKKASFTPVLLSVIALALGACAQAPKTLYHWQGYNQTVYERLQNDGSSLGEQIDKMEQYFVQARDKQLAVAPGAHAHMGLLLVDAGQIDAAHLQFEQEKRLFPESSTFMDFLLKRKEKGEKK
ncbi:MAG: DUF4810 domain-containing protein [Neisseria sp.]|nr:DUF4810 domain-containing protein [Neisseria sp.]